MDEPPQDNRRGLIAGLVLVVALVVGGFWFMQHIRAASQIQDCVMSGRSNCAPIRS